MSDKILIVDDEPSNRNILSQELTHKGYSVLAASDGREALRKVESSRPDLIILDYMMPDLSGLEVLKELRKKENDIPVVMITAYGTMERAVEAMKEGAYDFITRPYEPDHIALVVRKALERQRLKRGVEILSEEVEERYHLVVGESAEMKVAVEVAKKAACSNATVLLLGESGSGKEIFARAIHNWSERKDRPFIAINSVGLSKELLESELFGHEQGAFTGAHRRKTGKIELAHGGTIFSTRSAMSLRNFKPSSCASSRNGSSSEWAESPPFPLMSG
jgi:DNA-binding NtrC family response regulator